MTSMGQWFISVKIIAQKKLKFSSPRCENSKKHKGVAPFTITEYFGSQQPYKSYDPMQIHFIKDLVLF
jgi:hypothetical protein